MNKRHLIRLYALLAALLLAFTTAGGGALRVFAAEAPEAAGSLTAAEASETAGSLTAAEAAEAPEAAGALSASENPETGGGLTAAEVPETAGALTAAESPETAGSSSAAESPEVAGGSSAAAGSSDGTADGGALPGGSGSEDMAGEAVTVSGDEETASSPEEEGVLTEEEPAEDALPIARIMPSGFMRPAPISLSEEEENTEAASGGLESAALYRQYGDSEWDQYVSHYFYKQLSDDEKTLYDRLAAVCEAVFTDGKNYTANSTTASYYDSSGRKRNISIYGLDQVAAPSSLSQQDVYDVEVLFLEENPQYYFLSNWYSAGTNGGTARLYLYDEFNLASERASVTEALRSRLSGWVSQVEAQNGMLAKEKKAHDIVAGHITYNNADLNNPLNQSVYSAYKGTTVCTGYAKLFSMLCNAVGIDTQVVTSSSHAWGMVRAEGAWYYTDPTWDDQGTTIYKWFNRSASVALALDTDRAHQAESFYALPAMSKDSGGTATLPAADGKVSDPVISVTAYGTKYEVEITCPAGATLYYAARTSLTQLPRLGQSWQTGISASSGVSLVLEDTPHIFAKAERRNYADSSLVYAYAPDSQAGDSEETEIEWTRPAETTVNVSLTQESFTYTGLAIKPGVSVTDGTKVLEEGADYTVSYANNVNAADVSAKKPPTVTVKFRGNYSGSVKRYFTIVRANLSDQTVRAEYNVGNTVLPAKTKKVKQDGVSTQVYVPQYGKPVVWYCGKKLALNRDYTLSYPDTDPSAAYDESYGAPGSYTIRINGKAPNYEGSTDVLQIVKEGTAEAPLYNLASATVRLYYQNKLLNGANKIYYSPEKTPHALITVSYKDKTGAYSVSVSGQIQGFYENDQNPGTVTLRLYPRAGGTLYGTKNITYKVEAVDLAKAGDALQVALPSESVTYERTGVKPKPAVSYAGTALSEGVDYKLSWSGNNKVTESAKLKVTGMGGFKGSVQKGFSIEQKSISGLNFYTEDPLWSGSKNAYTKARIIVSDENGAELKAGTDYTLSFSTLTGSDTPAVGERIWAQIEGKGNYTGKALRSLKPAEASIAKGKLTLLDDAGEKAKNYSYAIDPVTLTKSNLSFTLNGQTLTEEDYKISGFIGNTAKGTAKVILEGKNAFGGMAVFNYSVAAKAVK